MLLLDQTGIPCSTCPHNWEYSTGVGKTGPLHPNSLLILPQRVASVKCLPSITGEELPGESGGAAGALAISASNILCTVECEHTQAVYVCAKDYYDTSSLEMLVLFCRDTHTHTHTHTHTQTHKHTKTHTINTARQVSLMNY